MPVFTDSEERIQNPIFNPGDIIAVDDRSMVLFDLGTQENASPDDEGGVILVH